MILQFLLQIILLSLPTNALTLKSNSTSSSKNDSNSFLYAIEPNPSAGNCFDADRYRISNKSFIKKINWEVLEFSSVRDQKSYYGVKYCQAKIPWALQRFNASVGDEEDGDQECSYIIYDSYFLEKVRDRLQLPADCISYESFIKRINLEVLEFFQGQEQNSYYGIGNCHAKILYPVQSRYLSALNVSSRLSGKGILGAGARAEFNHRELALDNYSTKICNRSFWVGFSLQLPVGVHKGDESEGINNSYSLENHHFRGPFHLLLILAVTCLGNVILLVAWRWLGKITKKRKGIKMNERFFERNGGLLLQQLLNSFGANVARSFKLFKLTELNKATDHFNVKRVLGRGGQGIVYKGMLEDGRIIAIKKSNVVDEGKIEEFINEIVILAQINHRNVVKLLGCCLEAEVPLLVYEFISNGTLFQYLHDQNEEFPLKWETRLRIATEVSSALSYMHSGASFSIFHRDIKSTNILLDNNYTAKVADFGASRSISIDKTHLSTIILGTLGYLDPEYFQSSRLTEKSDVYSFGVVLVELLTGQKPIFLGSSQENISLAAYFIRCMKEKRLYDILDAQVKQDGKKDEIMVFANLAKSCLNQIGKERPTMKEIVIELEGIPLSKKKKVSFREVIKRFRKGD